MTSGLWEISAQPECGLYDIYFTIKQFLKCTSTIVSILVGKSVHQKNKQRLKVFWMTIYIRLEI